MAKDSLADILGAPELAPTPTQGAPDASGGDPAVWTLLGEAGTDPQGQLAVASTYYNRAKKLGRTAQAVVTDPGQGYEAWQDSKARSATQKRYPVGSPAYTAAQGVLNGVMSGQTPALPYTHFYGPKAQADKGRQPPNWATGTGTDIGGNRFYALDDVSSTAPDLTDILGVKGELAADPDVRITATDATPRPGPASDPQKTTLRWLNAHGFYDENAAKGSSQYPLAETASSGAPTTKGTWYVARSGELRQVGNDAPDLMPQYQALAQTRAAEQNKPLGNRLLTGAEQGAYDVVGSVNRLLPTIGSVNFINPEAPGPMTPQQSIEASAELDKDYTATRNGFDLVHGPDPAAMVGRGGAQLALTAPTMAVGGELPELGLAGNLLLRGGSEAAQGAGASLLTSATSDAPLPDQLAAGAGVGIVAGRTAPIARSVFGGAGNALGAPFRVVKGVVEPFTEGGRENIVNRFIRDRAVGGPTAADITSYVPGSRPTLAQATGNPGIATLERGVKVTNPTPFASLQASNEEARNLAMDALRGDAQSLDDLIAARTQAADPQREAAFANTTPTDPSSVIALIDETLASPAGKRDAVRLALTNIRRKITDDAGNLERDPAQLYGIRQAIGDAISARGAGTEADTSLARRELIGVRDALDPVIEAGAPGFRGYLQTFAEASRPVSEQKYLQSLNITDSRGNITLGRIDSALKRIETARGKPGANDAKSISDATLQSLYALRADLRRAANSELGRGSGSDTAQKLATNNLVSQVSGPTALALGAVGHHPVVGTALGLGRMALGTQDRRIFDLLTNKLLDGEYGSAALTAGASEQTGRSPIARAIGYLARPAYVPVSVLGNRLLTAPTAQTQ